jgi:acetyl-CoA acetyltransferase
LPPAGKALMARTDKEVAIIGVGYTPLSRRPEHPETELAISACCAAAQDAGINPSAIDGINIQVHHYPPPDTGAIVKGLGLTEVRWSIDGGLGVGPLGRAAEVVDAGLCEAVVVCKVMNTMAPVTTPEIDPETGVVGGPPQFDLPYGLGYTMQRVGFLKRRWMERYCITDEQVGWLCVVQRQHALLNPNAVMKKPLTLGEYRQSRWIADPIHLLDCDYPVNGAYAYIVGRPELALAAGTKPIRLLAWAGPGEGDSIPHLRPEGGRGMNPWAREVYRDSGLGPEQMDVWMLYDGFSFLAMQWMEELGLVGPGESGAYVEGGERILYSGEHPMNTHGGQLSEGRMHAAGHLLEAVQQLRGSAGARQSAHADRAIVSSAYPFNGAVAILGEQ